MTMLFKPKRVPVEQTEAERLYDISYPILMAPWFAGFPMDPKKLTPIRVRRLGDSAVLTVGDFGLIKSFAGHLGGEVPPTLEEMNAYAERQDEICKLTMVNPTYDEMLKIAGAHVDSAGIQKQLDELRALFKQLPKGPEKKKLKDEYDALELTSKFLLPPDFMAFVTHYALSVDKNDIDDMTEEMLLNCAVLATRGGDNPSDHFPGRITPRVRKEFDNKAWGLLDAEQKARAQNKKKGR